MGEKERERAMTEYDRGYMDAYFRYKPQGDELKRA